MLLAARLISMFLATSNDRILNDAGCGDLVRAPSDVRHTQLKCQKVGKTIEHRVIMVHQR